MFSLFGEQDGVTLSISRIAFSRCIFALSDLESLDSLNYGG